MSGCNIRCLHKPLWEVKYFLQKFKRNFFNISSPKLRMIVHPSVIELIRALSYQRFQQFSDPRQLVTKLEDHHSMYTNEMDSPGEAYTSTVASSWFKVSTIINRCTENLRNLCIAISELFLHRIVTGTQHLACLSFSLFLLHQLKFNILKF